MSRLLVLACVAILASCSEQLSQFRDVSGHPLPTYSRIDYRGRVTDVRCRYGHRYFVVHPSYRRRGSLEEPLLTNADAHALCERITAVGY